MRSGPDGSGSPPPRSWVPGYPVDERREPQRLRAAGSVPGDFEYAAGRVIARYTGELVVLVDDGCSDSMVDLRIEYVDGRVGVGEVVLDLDEDWAATYAAVRKRGFKIGGASLTRQWFLWLDRRCNLKRVEAEVATVLRGLEEADWPMGLRLETRSSGLVSTTHRGSVAALARLGVRSAASHEANPAGIQLVPQGTGGFPETWDAFDAELTRLLHAETLSDVRWKLDRTLAAERHLFLGTTFSSSWALNFGLREERDELPPEPPHLPSQVTHLWLWCTYPPSRVLGWFPDRGWFDAGRDWATD